ncbi:F0F1 ATP synthase subunit epsilon [Ostreiculturibacter nitratireducens]|uniref:F0F1 ATP synthase subunit epsilon n=1 Tax=Ostreiculturibacter nitratireducens TaxID=3075226 RepID=UPI0031B5A2C4
MKLEVVTPEERVFDGEVTKIVAEATNGSFGILPRHIDLVAPLTAGILFYEDKAGEPGFVGVDEGILVKCGDVVSVAVRRAVVEHDLANLRRIVRDVLTEVDEHERAARGALARLEAGVVRRMLELERRA